MDKINLIKVGTIGGLSYYFFDLVYDTYKYNYLPVPNHLNTYGRGSYALITGASEGIGFQFAKTLASQGFNIILLSRSQEKLNSAAEYLTARYQVKTLIYPMDLISAQESDFKSLLDSTSNLNISILVNNAGMIVYKQNEDISYPEINQIVNLNSLAAARLMHYYLPRFEKRKNKSAVINISSLLAVQPCSVLALHSASKAFIHYMTVGLSEQYSGKIDFLSYQPGHVNTKMMVTDTNPIMIDADQAVNECLKDLGVKTVSYGHYKHTFAAYALSLLPQSIRLKQIATKLNKDLELSKGK